MLARLLLLATAAAAAAANEVLELTAADFDAHVETHALTLVTFYAPWCGHCQQLLPELDAAAQSLPAGALAKVDCTAEESLYWAHEVTAFPTLKLFVDGAAVDASGRVAEHSVDALLDFWRQLEAPVEAFRDAGELQLAAAENSPWPTVVGVGLEAAALERAARLAEGDLLFATLSGEADATELGAAAAAAPALLLLKPYDERVVEAAPADVPDVAAWVAEQSRPRVLPYAVEFLDLMFSPRFRTHALLFVDGAQDGGAYAAAVADAARALTAELPELIFVVVDAAEELQIAEALQVDAEALPALRLAFSHDEQLDKFAAFEGDGTLMAAEAVEAFVRGCADGSVEPFATSGGEDDEPLEEDDGVTALTDATFDDALEAAGGSMLVEFYAPWCGHCQQLAPEYARAAAALAQEGLLAAKVDATENSELARRFGIEGFPTIKLLRDFEVEGEYEGERSAEGLVQFALQGPTVDIESADDLRLALRAAHPRALAVLVLTEEDEAAREAYTAAAKMSEGPPFAVVASAEAAAVLGLAHGEVALVKPAACELWSGVGEAPVELVPATEEDEDMDEEDDFYGYGSYGPEPALEFWIERFPQGGDETVADWVDRRFHPRVAEFSDDNVALLFESGITTHVLVFVDPVDEAATDAAVAALAAAAPLLERAQMVLVDVHAEPDVNEYLQVDAEATPLPCMRIATMSTSQDVFLSAEEVSAESLAAFVGAFAAGELSPAVMSEDEAEVTDLADPVPSLVGDNLARIAGAADNDALVFFYAPWCPHCADFEPEYEHVAASFADLDSVLIARFDGTANGIAVPGVQLEAFPTLYFFPGDGEPVEYTGEMDAESVEGFVVEHLSVLAGEDGGEGGDSEL